MGIVHPEPSRGGQGLQVIRQRGHAAADAVDPIGGHQRAGRWGESPQYRTQRAGVARGEGDDRQTTQAGPVLDTAVSGFIDDYMGG